MTRGAAKIGIPNFAEQRRIIARVDDLNTLCDKLRARVHVERAKRAQQVEALVALAVTA